MISGFFTNLPFDSNFLRKKRSSHQGKKEIACIVSKTSSFMFVGMWRVCKSSKIKHPGGSRGIVLWTKRRPRPATQDFCFFCQITSFNAPPRDCVSANQIAYTVLGIYEWDFHTIRNAYYFLTTQCLHHSCWWWLLASSICKRRWYSTPIHCQGIGT